MSEVKLDTGLDPALKFGPDSGLLCSDRNFVIDGWVDCVIRTMKERQRKFLALKGRNISTQGKAL